VLPSASSRATDSHPVRRAMLPPFLFYKPAVLIPLLPKAVTFNGSHLPVTGRLTSHCPHLYKGIKASPDLH
jgi:hypothetical protein